MSFTSAAALPAFCPDLHDQDKDKQRVKTKTPHDRPERLISFGEVHHRTGLSRTTGSKGKGNFPDPSASPEADGLGVRLTSAPGSKPSSRPTGSCEDGRFRNRSRKDRQLR
jgi:hypothetical protein